MTDDKGAPVSDLTAADLVVKEGGKEREVTKAAPASAKMRLTLAVEERLIADTSIRQAIFEFLKRLSDYAEIRMITIGLRNPPSPITPAASTCSSAPSTSSR